MTPLLPITVFTNWLAFGERGLSSDAIVSTLTGTRVGRRTTTDYPFDPSDFRRCVLLLEAVPVARFAFPAMREVSPVWARLVDAWDELEALAVSEVPDWPHPKWNQTAPLLYARFKEVRNEPTS